jgi:hypothetical protein
MGLIKYKTLKPLAHAQRAPKVLKYKKNGVVFAHPKYYG